MNIKEYIEDLVEEVITNAVEYGREPSDTNELALAESTELLYNTLDTYTSVVRTTVKVLDQKIKDE